MASPCEENSILSKLAKNSEWSSYPKSVLYQYEGFWYPRLFIDGVLKAHELDPSDQLGLSPKPKDIILCSSPKSGTTWLKSLAFSIVTRTRFGQSSPILTSFAHDLIPYIETSKPRDPQVPLLSTHMPYSALAKSITIDSDLGCKIVYICRNPKDVLVSFWHYQKKIGPAKDEPLPLEKAFDLFCRGVSSYGPYWDHVLRYWKASLDHPERVLFLRYEDMMEDAGPHVRRLAEFMGYPFSEEEDGQGIPARIVEMCSFGNLSKLDVNQADQYHTVGVVGAVVKSSNSILFRKAKVGDWRNYLTDQMAAEIDEISLEKLGKFGLTV